MPDKRPEWARHYLDDWRKQADDVGLPYWLRLACLAYGTHGYNNHAPFKRGEIAKILGGFDPTTGVLRPLRNLQREIGTAVEKGWLAEDSYWGCLVVPETRAMAGSHGTDAAPCTRHKKPANHSLSERKGSASLTPSECFNPVTTHSVSDSERDPLFSVLSPARQGRHAQTKRSKRPRKEAS